MSAQRIRVTWEFAVDSGDALRSTVEALNEVTRKIRADVAVTDEVRIIKAVIVIPRVTTATRP